MKRLFIILAAAMAVLLVAATAFAWSTGLVGDGGDDVAESSAEPVDLDLAGPTYAAGTPEGLLVRSGGATRILPNVDQVLWLPGGRALLTSESGTGRIWYPETDTLGPPTQVATRGSFATFYDIKRSVTQINVTAEQPKAGAELSSYSTDLERRWRTELPGPINPNSGPHGMERTYQHGHTIGGLTYLMFSEFEIDGDESDDAHYGILRVDDRGEVVDTVQLDKPIVSVWLSSDGASLLALRRVADFLDPCGGCQVSLELVELDPATGEVRAEYGMPEEYGKSWDATEVDKVGDRVAIRFTEYVEEQGNSESPGRDRLRGTWIRDDDGWTMMPGSRTEITWWQGEDRIIARPDGGEFNGRLSFDLFWAHGDTEEALPGRWRAERGRHTYLASVPGQALPPA